MARFTNDNDFINRLLVEFAESVITQRIEQVRATKSVTSSELINSYAYEIRKATTEQTASAMFAFAKHGRYLDLRRMNKPGGGKEYIAELVEWLRDGGLDKFRRTPSPERIKAPVGSNKYLNSLAWGIVRKKKKHKRRRLQKGWGGQLSELTRELMTGYQHRTVSEIKEAFKTLKNGNS